MTPIDYRNSTWDEVQSRLTRDRDRVWNGLKLHGPLTTRQLAEAMGWDILNVRPRVTELVQLGFAEVQQAPGEAADTRREGTYRARSWTEARTDFESRKRSATQPNQLAFL